MNPLKKIICDNIFCPVSREIQLKLWLFGSVTGGFDPWLWSGGEVIMKMLVHSSEGVLQEHPQIILLMFSKPYGLDLQNGWGVCVMRFMRIRWTSDESPIGFLDAWPTLCKHRYRSMSPAGRQSLQFYNEYIKSQPIISNGNIGNYWLRLTTW